MNLQANMTPPHTSRSARARTAMGNDIKARREQLEKGLFGLNLELKKQQEKCTENFDTTMRETNELQHEFYEFREKVFDEIKDAAEDVHRRFTEYKGHINDVLLEYKESILFIQAYVDNQLIVSRRDRVDMNLLLDNLLKKTKFHDKVSNNFHDSMSEIKTIMESLVEILNINYHLQTQDEKDRDTISLIGMNKSFNPAEYTAKEKYPITLDKSCLN